VCNLDVGDLNSMASPLVFFKERDVFFSQLFKVLLEVAFARVKYLVMSM